MSVPSTNTLQATVLATDANGNTSINRGLGNPTLAGLFSKLVESASIAAGTVNLLGGGDSSPVFNIYIKNNAAPGSGITLTPVLTPNGGAAQTLAPLEPGGVFIWWQQTNSVANGGYTNVSVTAAGGTCAFEYMLGA